MLSFDMNRRLRMLTLLTICLTACAGKPALSPVAAPPTPSASPIKETAAEVFEHRNQVASYICQSTGEKRTLWIEAMSPNGCKLWYSRVKDTPVASSRSSDDHCLSVNEKILGKLTRAGFKCTTGPK